MILEYILIIAHNDYLNIFNLTLIVNLFHGWDLSVYDDRSSFEGLSKSELLKSNGYKTFPVISQKPLYHFH